MCFPLRTFFIQGNRKELLRIGLGEQGGWGMGVMPVWVKNWWTLSTVWADVLINHPWWNGQMCWKSLPKKNSLKPNMASHNTTSWHTDTDGFLEHSPSRGSLYYMEPTLQKIIAGFLWGPSSYIHLHFVLTLLRIISMEMYKCLFKY